MYFIQYYDTNLKGELKEELKEALGDRSVVICDGRNSIETMKSDAIKYNGFRRPLYKAFRIFKGESFTRSNPITEIIKLGE